MTLDEAQALIGTLRLKAEVLDATLVSLMVRFGAQGDFCHVGSKAWNGNDATRWRDRITSTAGGGFVGIDIEDGVNVDVLADLCDPGFTHEHPEMVGRFGWVFCSALLEHVEDPFQAARNVQALVAPGGFLHYGGPWVCGYHAYPDDFWRFSFSGIKRLFPTLEWRDWFYTGSTGKLGLRLAETQERKAFRTMHAEGAAAIISDRSMPILNINAIGQKPAA